MPAPTAPFDLQGHRGARGLFPENTLDGFRDSIALGVTSFELDVAVTRDGVAVVHHDPALNPDLARGADGAWLPGRGPLLRELSWEELGTYDVGRLRPGSPTAHQFPDQRPRDGARVPRLADVLALRPECRFLIELKLFPHQPDWTVLPERMAELAVDAADAAGASARCTFQSFHWAAPRHLRRARPELALAWLTRDDTARDAPAWWQCPAPRDPADVPALVAEAGGGTWTPDHATLTPELVRRGHAHGLRVVPWTVNDAGRMRALAGWGVDGLITDRPDIGLRALPASTLPDG